MIILKNTTLINLNIVSKKENTTLQKKLFLRKRRVVLIFILSILCGVILTFYGNKQLISGKISSGIGNEVVENMMSKKGVLNIFINNCIVGIIMIIGIFSKGAITYLLLSINGVFIGIVFSAYLYTDINILFPILSVLPHALFDVPALFLCALIGLSKFDKQKLKEYKKFFIIIMVLLLLGAIVEGSISVHLAKILIGT